MRTIQLLLGHRSLEPTAPPARRNRDGRLIRSSRRREGWTVRSLSRGPFGSREAGESNTAYRPSDSFGTVRSGSFVRLRNVKLLPFTPTMTRPTVS